MSIELGLITWAAVRGVAAARGEVAGAFAGAAVFFGTSSALWGTVIALVVGACLGWLSDLAGQHIQKLVGTPATAEP